MSEIKLQAGHWYRDRQGEILYCISTGAPRHKGPMIFVCEYRNRNCDFFRENGWYTDPNEKIKDLIEHLTDCTGFDWVPPKRPDAPEGWRWLEDDEKIQDGDNYWNKRHKDGNPFPDLVYSSVGKTWNGIKPKYDHCWGVLRKIEPPQPKYRPFKDGVEFEPFRDEWFCDSVNTSFRVKVTAYDSEHVWFAGASVGQRYAEAFKHRKREDGTPFGVLDAS